MSKKIFYYSRTGSCAKVAHSYGKNGQGHLIRVMDNPEDRYWGALGYIKGALNTIGKKDIPYRLVGERNFDAEEVILITPVWAGEAPVTFRSFLLKETFDPKIKVTVVTVSGSGKGRDTFHQIVEILQKAGVQEIRHRNLKTKEVE